MANDETNPEVGELFIDARETLPFIEDLPEGATRGMRSEQEGFAGVLLEILANQAEWGEKAGITGSDFSDLSTANERIALIDRFLPAAYKMVEMLEESRAKLDNQRQRAVHGFARSVEDRAKVHAEGPALLAKYQKTRTYKSAIGMKAYKTRIKNARDAEAQETPSSEAPPA